MSGDISKRKSFASKYVHGFSGNRRKIIIEDGCFPSDYWICRSHIEMSGNNPDEDLVVIKPRPGELLINDDDIINKIRELGKNLADQPAYAHKRSRTPFLR